MMSVRRRNATAGYARNRGCRTKRSYPTREAAYAAREVLIAKGTARWRIQVYGKNGGANAQQPCQFCKGWHIGHKIERKF
jgi:hypothetical protein